MSVFKCKMCGGTLDINNFEKLKKEAASKPDSLKAKLFQSAFSVKLSHSIVFD